MIALAWFYFEPQLESSPRLTASVFAVSRSSRSSSHNVHAHTFQFQAPAGVGFSTPARSANDASTTSDAAAALRCFLQKHPARRANLEGGECWKPA